MRTPNASVMTEDLLATSPEEILEDLFVAPRAAVRKWAERTNQTTQAKLAYLGQHLASVLTAVPGEGTAARGHDLIDGSEVKTCSRADQLGSCRECGAPVPAWCSSCGGCDSTNIDRKTDSHWIFAVRSEAELEQYLTDPRVVLVLLDRTHEQTDIRVRAWEIWPEHPDHAYFRLFLQDYFENNYLVKGSRAAPANLHPLKFDFLMMNPIRTFDARLINVDEPTATVLVDEHFDPTLDRDDAPIEAMKPSLCKPEELRQLTDFAQFELEPVLADGKTLDDLTNATELRGPAYRAAVDAILPDIPPAARLPLPMRDKRIKTSESSYSRRSRLS